jgi:alpha-L-fucosidase
MEEFYRYAHSLQPDLLIGNNHHIAPLEGEDFQMFERDLPGENKAGLSGQEISKLPLEMCQTMNGMWGYKVADQNYKSSEKLIELLTRAASKGSNLLLNIGPQPNGELPATALNRLKEMGQWLRQYGETIYGTQAGPTGDQPWGVSTQKGNSIFLHVFDAEVQTIETDCPKKPRAVVDFISGHKLAYTYNKKARRLTVRLPQATTPYQRVVTITVK